LNALTADKYKAIEDDMLKITGRQSRKDIHIEKLLEGSIIVYLMIEAENKSQ
jgi:hypothetical protein